MSDRASSVPFRVGPPSPDSPASGYLKENRPLFPSSDQIPQTPTSPPLMSVSAPSHASNFASSQASPSQTTSQPANLSSPPSSAPMSTQVSQQPTLNATNSFPTPASSVSGHLASADSERADMLMDPGKQETGETTMIQANAALTQPAEHRRTDHDRQFEGADPGTEVRDFTHMDSHQTVNDADAMDLDNKNDVPVLSENNDEPSLDSLQREFTSAYHLCKSSHVATGPDPSIDLVSLYGLGPIAKSLARTDPITGEKINRLRKSYEGKLKGLGLAGRNKPVKNDPTMPGGLRYLTMWPEEEWQNQKVHGKNIKVADMDSALHKLQMSAMKMEPGPVPNNDYWEDVLGHEKPSKAGDVGKKTVVPPGGARATGQSDGTPVPAEPERTRPSRGRKRNYGDNSYVGYGEGYVDDEDESAFYSNSEGAGKKKRKKNHVSRVSTPLSERGGSYGVGMFGIGAR